MPFSVSLASSIFFSASASFLRGKARQAPPGMGRSLRLQAQAAKESCRDWHHIAICPVHWVGRQFGEFRHVLTEALWPGMACIQVCVWSNLLGLCHGYYGFSDNSR